MARDRSAKHAPKTLQMRVLIAAQAARLMAEDGIDDFATAKRKAARRLGATDTESLPSNEEVAAELKIYLTLYKRDEHAERLRALREAAVEIMADLAPFRPYLVGSVLTGTAGRYADLDLHVFTEDAKAIEFFLHDRGLEFKVEETRYFCGDEPRLIPTLTLEWDDIPLRIAVMSLRDERAGLKTSIAGRVIERATANAVAELLADADTDQ